MLGLFAGQPGARAWRRYLSEHAHCDGAGVEVLEQALRRVPDPVKGEGVKRLRGKSQAETCVPSREIAARLRGSGFTP